MSSAISSNMELKICIYIQLAVTISVKKQAQNSMWWIHEDGWSSGDSPQELGTGNSPFGESQSWSSINKNGLGLLRFTHQVIPFDVTASKSCIIIVDKLAAFLKCF